MYSHSIPMFSQRIFLYTGMQLKQLSGNLTIMRHVRFVQWTFKSSLENLTSLAGYLACLDGTVGSVALRAAWLRRSASPGSRPRLAGSQRQVIAACALKLNSRAGTEGSTVSSLICDRWLILGLETLSISRCLNH